MKVFLLQVVMAAIVVWVLKALLERELIQMAIEQIMSRDAWPEGDTEKVLVLTAKKVSESLEGRIKRAIKERFPGAEVAMIVSQDILGGIVVKTDHALVDLSLLGRLKYLLGRQSS